MYMYVIHYHAMVVVYMYMYYCKTTNFSVRLNLAKLAIGLKTLNLVVAKMRVRQALGQRSHACAGRQYSAMSLVRWLQVYTRETDGTTASANTGTSSVKEKGKLPLL